jgi:hypothetical protein
LHKQAIYLLTVYFFCFISHLWVENVTSRKVAVSPRNMHFDFAKGVHLGRYRIGGLNFKNSAQAPQTA